MTPHSSKVRGAQDNPKTQEAKTTPANRAQLGDPASLEPETTSTEPNPAPSSEDSDSKDDPGAPIAPGTTPERPGSRNQSHSVRVRGTMSHMSAKNGDGKPRSMLGDHTSLRAETTDTEPTDDDRGVGPPDDEEELKEVARRRKENEVRSGVSRSKL